MFSQILQQKKECFSMKDHFYTFLLDLKLHKISIYTLFNINLFTYLSYTHFISEEAWLPHHITTAIRLYNHNSNQYLVL